MKTWREECGVIGVWNHEQAARLTYLGLYAIQHRGQESCGIVSRTPDAPKNFKTHRGLGLVADVFKEPEFERLPGDFSIGHVRYSTTGENQLVNAQPLTASLRSGPVAIAHNGNIVNAVQLKAELQEQGAIFQGTNDTECLLHLLSRTPTSDIVEALKMSLSRIEGAYSLAVMTHDQLLAVRDPNGFRPLVLGEKLNAKNEKSYILASETCVFDLIGAKLVREIKPGEILSITKDGIKSFQFAEEKASPCIFEHIYFSRPDSIIFNQSVYESRKKFGQWLARENPVEADIVIPIPDSGVPSAIGYSNESDIPFEFGIIRNHYVGRTFIQPHQAIRDFGVKIKLNAQSAVLTGKRVVVVDDSLVRGTTSQKIVSLIRQAGAKEVHVKIASPPTMGPCYYGVDTPHRSQLIAANQSLDEIRRFIGADSLSYLSIEGLFSAMGNRSFCAACFDGKYPTPLYT